MTTYGQLTYHRMQTGRPLWGITALPHVMIRIKRVLPRVKAERTGTVYLADTPDTAVDIEWICSRWPLEMDDRTAEHLATQAARWRRRREELDELLAGHVNPLLAEPARTPRDYQLVAAEMGKTAELGRSASASGSRSWCRSNFTAPA